MLESAMPSIELVSINCRHIPALPQYASFAYRVDTRLESDRALFQPVFDTLNGVIVHLANKDLEGHTEGWFAGEIMDWTQTNIDRAREMLSMADALGQTVEGETTVQDKVAAVKEYLEIHDILPVHYDPVLAFRPETRPDMTDLMQRLLAVSPEHRMTFSSDYQFGGVRRECGEVTLTEFFNLHDRRLLKYNSLFYIRAD